MRQVILDTETTGLEPSLGHRVIEIAAVELLDRRLSGSQFHRYINPRRDIDPGALQVHGLSREFLSDKPGFEEVAGEFLSYVAGAELIIHNAPFDLGFLDRELGLLEHPAMAVHCPSVIDSLRLARELHPGKRNSLDALCERYQVDNSARTRHGALLDAELLALVYLAMTRGQEALNMDFGSAAGESEADGAPLDATGDRVLLPTLEELAAHEAQLLEIQQASKGACLWLAAPERTP